MAKLGFTFDPVASEIESLLAQHRCDEARERVAALLRDGVASVAVQQIAAELLVPTPRGRGRPRNVLPWKFSEIGKRFEELCDSGVGYDAAIDILVNEFGRSASTIARRVAVYRAAREAATRE